MHGRKEGSPEPEGKHWGDGFCVRSGLAPAPQDPVDKHRVRCRAAVAPAGPGCCYHQGAVGGAASPRTSLQGAQPVSLQPRRTGPSPRGLTVAGPGIRRRAALTGTQLSPPRPGGGQRRARPLTPTRHPTRNLRLHAAGSATRSGFSLVSGIRGLPGPTNPEAVSAAPARAARALWTASPRDRKGRGRRRRRGLRAPRGQIARVWPLPALPRSAGGKSSARHPLLPRVLSSLSRAPNGPHRGRAGRRHQRLGRQLLPEPGPLCPQGGPGGGQRASGRLDPFCTRARRCCL